MNLSQYFIDYFEQSPAIIKLAWIVSSVYFIIIVSLVIYLKFLINSLRKKEELTAKYEKEYESYLISYLYAGNKEEDSNSEQQLIINYLKKCITNPFKREIVVSTLSKLKNEISGKIAESIEKLYFEIGLMNYSLPKLRNKKSYIIAKGIRELMQFNAKKVHDEVMIHINHSEKEVRKEVELYMVNIFHFEGLDFLNGLQTPLSEWDQIELLEILQKFNNPEIFNIKQLLNSSNDSVVIFALKLAKIYNQFDTKDELINMLDHENPKIRMNAIHVLNHLNVIEAKEVLKSNFNERSQEEQIAFFKMMENLYESSDEPFVLKHIHHENFEIKVSALKILKTINIDKFNILKFESSEPQFVKIINFMKNN